MNLPYLRRLSGQKITHQINVTIFWISMIFLTINFDFNSIGKNQIALKFTINLFVYFHLELFFRSFKKSINGCDHQALWIMQEASNWNIWYSSWCIYLDKPSSTEAIRLFNRFSGREENFSAWISARNVTSLKYWAHRVGNCGGDHMFSLCLCKQK